MRQIAFFVWAILVAMAEPCPAGAQSPAGNPLTLADAVQTALQYNPAVEAADAYSQAVEHGMTAAKAGRYPRVDFSETATRGNNPVYVFGSLLSQGRFAAPNFALSYLNFPPPLNNFRSQFSAAMPVWDAGQTSRHVKGAQLESQSAAKASERTRQEIIFNVIQAYLNGLLARESMRVAEAAVAAAESDLKRSEARTEQGLAVPSDLLSARVQLAQAQEDLLRAKNAVALADAALNAAMGVPDSTPVVLASPLGDVSFEAGTLDERQQRAFALRPDFQRAQIGEEQAANERKGTRFEFMPTFSVFGSWEQNNRNFLSNGNDNWIAGASLTFNIFDGGERRARLKAATARQRQAGALRDQLAAVIRLQVREAFLNLTTARDRVEVSRGAAGQAEESLRITQNRYEAGLATITDLLRAETAHTAAQRNFLNALFDYRLGIAALELATGELSPNSSAVQQ
jgi:outer membrane protein